MDILWESPHYSEQTIFQQNEDFSSGNLHKFHALSVQKYGSCEGWKNIIINWNIRKISTAPVQQIMFYQTFR